MIKKDSHLISFNFLLKKFIQQNIKGGKIKDYYIPVEDYNFFSFYNILKDDFNIEAVVVRLEHEDLEELPFPASPRRDCARRCNEAACWQSERAERLLEIPAARSMSLTRGYGRRAGVPPRAGSRR